MKELVIWSALWFGVWLVLNIYFRWKWEKLNSNKFVPRGLFFLTAFVIMFYVFQNLIEPFLKPLLIGFVISNVIGLIMTLKPKLHKRFSKDRFFLLFQSFNILFQQTSILVAILIFSNMFKTEYKSIYFGVFFIAIHFPLIFLPWAKLKYWILASCFFGGWIFSFLNLNYTNGLIVSFLIHYLLYVFEIFYLKDERKI